MRQILSLWRGLLYRLHCFRLSTEQCSSVLCMHTADCMIWSMTCKLHTESEMGAMLDSISDLCFAASYAANVLPKLQFDNWVIWVIAAVITICFCSVAAGFVALRWFIMRHTIANRIYRLLAVLAPACKHALFRQRAGIDCNCCLQCLCLFRCFDSSGLGSDDDLHGDCRKFKRECRRRLMHKHRPMLQTNINIILSPCNNEHDVIFAKGYCIIRPMGV